MKGLRYPRPATRSRTEKHGHGPHQNTGIVIQKCRIGATPDLQRIWGSFGTYLGRPWKHCSRTIIMQSMISDVIHPAGWHKWSDESNVTLSGFLNFINEI
ncbi:hypothetical protein SLE2022_258310 [Rubroshorea leprosula]